MAGASRPAPPPDLAHALRSIPPPGLPSASRAAPPPDLANESALWRAGWSRIVGGDACGLGCLSGPIVAAAVILPVGCAVLPGVRDSKLVGAAQREQLIDEIRAQAVAIGVGAASVAEVEQLNVRTAEILALRRAVVRLGGHDHVLIDGRPSKHVDFGPYTAIVDGDATCYSIACASIVAKVVRDRLMRKLARRHPEYGWEHNVGYGTPGHLAALRTYGPTAFHRRSYQPVRSVLLGQAAATAGSGEAMAGVA